ncbi:MAG: universal stress protein [Proteobacteria bacterium]|nr:universal stress protein [Pseudomonadota bacterium]MDA1058052.1 universal stress protein [Pseudomonadota bacterium]
MSDSLEARQFLVVVDDTPECRKALRFAWRRAHRTGAGVTLLRVIDPLDFQHWLSVEERMREEAREEADELLKKLAAEVQQQSTILPELVVREGDVREVVVKLIEEDKTIRILVLGAGTGSEGPGPLVSQLAGKMSGAMRVPVTVVPGNLSDAQLDLLT